MGILTQISLLCLTIISVGHCWKGKTVFQDEFNGNSLDLNTWQYEEGCTNYGSRNLECYKGGQSNVKVQNGILTITARIEKTSAGGKNYDYTSGRFRQKGEGFAYGAYVMRARLPDGKHLWPAFWLLKATDCKYEEIDILEYRGQERKNFEMAGHYGRRWDAYVSNGTLGTAFFDLSTGFHEFALLWRRNSLEWYVDNQKYFEVSLEPAKWRRDPNKTPCGSNIQPFAEKSNFYFNMAVGGPFFDNHGQLTVDEARRWKKPTYEIDWVRIYQGE